MKRLPILSALFLLLAGSALAQNTTDILGMHNLQGGGGSAVTGALPACLFCHAPHSSNTNASGLWSQKLSTVSNYTLYSGAIVNTVQQPALGSASNKCLSCHDGTVAPGQTSPYGAIQMKGTMGVTNAEGKSDVFGTDLSTMHPFNFKLPLDKSTPNILPSVINGTGTGSTAVKLINQNVQCTTCHDPHNQFIDSSNQFLVVDNTGSALCLACHTSAPADSAMNVKAKSAVHAMSSSGVPVKESLQSSLDNWKFGAHARASHKTRRGSVVGTYPTVERSGCAACHTAHGGKSSSLLIQPNTNNTLSLDQNTRNCLNCHDGGQNITPALPNILAEFNKSGHPLPAGSDQHQAGEKAQLDNNRHATCVDCHNPHTSKKTDTFAATTIRPAQNGVTGISESDGTVLQPAVNQYQNCLRCHGASSGKKTMTQYGYTPNFVASTADPLNILQQMGRSAVSAHPVMRDRQSSQAQPTLRTAMVTFDGRTEGRAMGNRILCSDCHNSDDSRESGGSGPAGPHGSIYPHILERRYEMSQVASSTGAGGTISNLYPNPSLDASCSSATCVSPYALCAKCHDLTKLGAAGSFSEHMRHINDGFSCSVCHTSHGMSAGSTLTGERLLNFDANVVGSNNGQPITYNRATGTCSLVCHNHVHGTKNATTLHTAGVTR